MTESTARTIPQVPVISARPVEYSIVIPVFNEQSSVPLLMERLRAVMNALGGPYEVVFVDDGSNDRTLQVLLAEQEHHPSLRIVELSRNFGKDIAVSAGLDHARGRAVIVMDADMQDPPELIPELVAKWRQGFEAVYATRRARHGESWLKRASSSLFYHLLSRTADIPIPRDSLAV